MTISRRSFVKAMGASLLVPSIVIDETKQKSIDMSPFCTDEFRRYDLAKPFFQEGLTYATDGRVCIRTHLVDAPESGDEVKLPRAAALNWAKSGSCWVDWRRSARRRKSDCAHPCPSCLHGWLGETRKCSGCSGYAHPYCRHRSPRQKTPAHRPSPFRSSRWRTSSE